MKQTHLELVRNSFRHILLIGFGLLAWSNLVFAQNQTSQENESEDEEDVQTLSPFEITSEGDNGYLATNTLAGSRLNSALRDTSATISVLTEEYLSDLGAFRLEEAMQYSVNTEFARDDARAAINENATFQNFQTYRVRGLDASVSRNYFPWLGRAIPSEAAFISRIEDSRGPNSVLFGIGSPGGTINVNTKTAILNASTQSVTGSVGSYGSYRGTVDINQPIIDDKLATRLVMVYNRDNQYRDWTKDEHQRVLLTTRWRPTEKMGLRVDFEGGNFLSNRPRAYNLDNSFLIWHLNGRQIFVDEPTAEERAENNLTNISGSRPEVTFIANNNQTISMRGQLSTGNNIPAGWEGRIADGGVIPLDTEFTDASINVGGPAQERFTDYHIITTLFEYQFGPNTFLELGWNHVDMTLDSRDPRGGNALKGDPNFFNLDGTPNPYAGRLYLDTQWFRTVRDDFLDTYRATFTTALDAGVWGNYRFAAMGEYEDSFIGSTTMREYWVDSATGEPAFNPGDARNAANRVTRRNYVQEGLWGSYHISGPQGKDADINLLDGVTDPVTGRTLSSLYYNQNYPGYFNYIRQAGMGVMQASWFENKLIFAGGLRWDSIEETQLPRWTDPVTGLRDIAPDIASADPGQQGTQVRNEGVTGTVGLVYHVTPQFSLIVNRADNLAVPGKGRFWLGPDGVPGDSRPVPKPEGQGEDYGIGFNLLDGKVYTKLIYFKTAAVGLSTTSPSAARNANTRIMDALLAQNLVSLAEYDERTDTGSHGLFDHASDGFEFELTANPVPNWRVQFSYSYTDAVEDNRFSEWVLWEQNNTQYLSQFDQSIVTESGDTIAEEIVTYQDEVVRQNETSGIGKQGNRKHKTNFVTRYTFSEGPMKGLYLGGTFRYQSKMFTGIDSSNNNEPIYGNSFWRSDFLCGYIFPQGWKDDHRMSVQLNVYNVFDNTDPLEIRYDEFGAVWRHIVQEPRAWRLTFNYDF